MSASAAAARATETKMDFMVVIVVSREEVVRIVGQLIVVVEMIMERRQNRAAEHGLYICSRYM
jgi:hypothetical protein